jgi:predicted AAA+ superfamily ATPase
LNFVHFLDDNHAMQLLERHIVAPILSSLKDTPVAFIQGARQTGKSTLAQSLAVHGHPARYFTLDDATTLSAAQSDPAGFVAGLDGPVILDEVQRAPGLALAIKAAVDADRKGGRFLLTGSTSVLVLPKLSESLAGRIEIHTLWPFSQGEIERHRDTFIDGCFQNQFQPKDTSVEGWSKLVNRLIPGGYPEMLHRSSADRRQAWFGSYITSILQRDVRDISNIRDLADLPRLLTLVASRAGSLLDYADLARGIGIPQTTLKRYMALLEATFLVQTLPAWFTNIGKRLVKAPKVYLNDTGLLAHLLGVDADRLRSDHTLGGGVLENFVAMELLKQRGWSKTKPVLHHYRTHGGNEVDLVLENRAGRIVGIEVKTSASIDAGHFKGLKALADAAGDRFVRGIVLYSGNAAVPFGKNLIALPMPTLWG